MQAVNSWRYIVAVASCSFGIVGLQADGTVVWTGISNHPDGAYSAPNWNPSFEWRNIIAIAAGGSTMVGLKSDGTVVATGDNKRG